MKRIILDRYDSIIALTKGKCVLDLGCVDHDLIRRDRSLWLHDVIRATAKKCVGVDYVQDVVEILKKEGYDIRAGNVETINLNEKFDLVMAGELIEHLPNPGRLLETARRHLNETGLLVLTTPNATGLYYFLNNLCFRHDRDNPDHCLMFTVCTMQKLLEKCGFEMVDAKYIMGWSPQGHASGFFRLLAWMKNIIKAPVYLLFPTLCHRMFIVARPLAGTAPS